MESKINNKLKDQWNCQKLTLLDREFKELSNKVSIIYIILYEKMLYRPLGNRVRRINIFLWKRKWIHSYMKLIWSCYFVPIHS